MPAGREGLVMRVRWLVVLLIGFVVGCGGGPTAAPVASPAAPAKKAKAHANVHTDDGLDDAALVDWGNDHTLEVVIDPRTGEAFVYVLDGWATKVVAIPAKEITLSLDGPPVVVPLTAKPQDGDPAGQSSRFVGTDPALAKEGNLTGSVSGKVNGKGYTGPFATGPFGKK